MCSYKPFTILVVEDDEVDRMNIERAFTKSNISNHLEFATNGLEALEKITGLPSPLLVLLDINMPLMNGIEFLEKLRNDPAYESKKLTPVIVLTTSKSDQDRLEAYKLSVVGYVVKPIAFGEFVEAMAALGTYWTINEFPKGW